MSLIELTEVPSEIEALRLTAILEQSGIRTSTAPRQRGISGTAFGFPSELGRWSIFVKKGDLTKAQEILTAQL
jgi:putative signal transducing protein